MAEGTRNNFTNRAGQQQQQGTGNGRPVAPPRNIYVEGNTKRYKPGERIDYDTVRIMCDGRDITGKCEFSPRRGTPWDRADKSVQATATYVTADGASSSVMFELRRKGGKAILVILLLLAVAAAVAAFLVLNPNFLGGEEKKDDDTGAYLIPQGNMTDEEAQALVNEMAEKSRITVSLAPEMAYNGDGKLRVNFVVPEPNNGLSERLEVTQGEDEKVIAKTGILKPGYMVEWIDVEQAPEIGPAVATVYAVTDGSDTGNPVSVEIQIVESKSSATAADASADGQTQTDGQAANQATAQADGQTADQTQQQPQEQQQQ